MKSLIVFIILVHCFSLNATAQEISYPELELNKPTSTFTLTVESIPESKGEIRIAVFDSQNTYERKEDPVHAVVVPVDEQTITWSDDSLPHGNYAIAVYHDKNTNGELDTNLIGIPKEAYGFSNNARGKFGPASWEDAKFTVDSDNAAISIQIQ
jgi:uncharacterized protein (DUF2141 family)